MNETASLNLMQTINKDWDYSRNKQTPGCAYLTLKQLNQPFKAYASYAAVGPQSLYHHTRKREHIQTLLVSCLKVSCVENNVNVIRKIRQNLNII